MKKIWLSTLLKFYAYVMVVILTIMGLVVAGISWKNQQAEADRIAQRVLTEVVTDLETSYQRVTQEGRSLVENPAKLEGVYRYFTLSPSEYETWRLNAQFPSYIQLSLHKNIDSLYLSNKNIEGIDVTLSDYKTVFVSTRQSKGGKQVSADHYKAPATAIPVPLTDPTTGAGVGIAYMTLDQEILTAAIDNARGDLPIAVRIFTPFGKEMYHEGDKGQSKDVKWQTRSTIYGYKVDVAVSESYLVKKGLANLTTFLSIAFLIFLILYLLLGQIFKNYRRQVLDLVDTMNLISQGESERRIDTSTKDQELLVIGNMINTMLDNMDKNIRDIYQLQLSQKDANMRALQAQINPHFMYNTLEFIRMYAVMQEQDELGDIIYEFSSLLRNNISDERVTTVENELEFCRKYSYLCMVRYPKSIAYGFKIDPGLEKMKIPKFTIQPLVENYFAHGVDHKRKDNVISVKVLQGEGQVMILVTDNGRGMEEEQLEKIQEILANRNPRSEIEEKSGRQSIGIVNVHERMLLYFGDRYHIQVFSQPHHGVTYTITIQDE